MAVNIEHMRWFAARNQPTIGVLFGLKDEGAIKAMADLLVEFNQHKKTPSDTLGVFGFSFNFSFAFSSDCICLAGEQNKARILSQRFKP
jgi:hypothetical protein